MRNIITVLASVAVLFVCGTLAAEANVITRKLWSGLKVCVIRPIKNASGVVYVGSTVAESAVDSKIQADQDKEDSDKAQKAAADADAEKAKASK